MTAITIIDTHEIRAASAAGSARDARRHHARASGGAGRQGTHNFPHSTLKPPPHGLIEISFTDEVDPRYSLVGKVHMRLWPNNGFIRPKRPACRIGTSRQEEGTCCC